jgi:hypothetical protein
VDQLDPDAATDPGDDPMAVGARLLDLFDRMQAGDRVVVLVLDDLQWADRPSPCPWPLCAAGEGRPLR